MSAEIIEKMLESGVPPLELVYYQVKSTARNENVGLRSELVINSIELGTLGPGQYGMISERTVQCVRLATWSFRRLISDMTEMIKISALPELVSIYIPARMLMKGSLKKLLSSARDSGFTYFDRLCIELPSGILLEDATEVTAGINALKNDFGVKFIMNGFADEFCPVFRISGLPLDMVMLDESVSNEDALASVPVRSAVKMANDLKLQCVLGKAVTNSAVNKAFSVGCAMYIQDRRRSISEVLNRE